MLEQVFLTKNELGGLLVKAALELRLRSMNRIWAS